METRIWLVPLVGVTVLTAIPLYARAIRGRSYALFGFVILAISLPGLVIGHHRLLETLPTALRPLLDALFAYGIAAAGVHLVGLVHARLRSTAFRLLVSVPGMMTVGAGALAGVWLLALLPVRAGLAALGYERSLDVLAWLDLVPFAIAAASLVTSIRMTDETVRIPLGGSGPADHLVRLPVERAHRRAIPPESRQSLRIVQIADPHLGPWQSVERLRRRIETLLAREPDLVLLTGDFLTMEGAATRGALTTALAPLRHIPGRCFAVFGNHDHEAPDEVRHALAANGVTLLVDEETTVESDVGPIQILGAQYIGRGRRRQLERLFARHPRRPGHLRLMLLHDPSAYRHVPAGEVDLTLSGHTHGGQIGLLSLGIDWTVLKRTGFPDHGLFGRGADRLYVNRGIGFYGFPLRIGVPGEASVLEVVMP
jgi:uncharacterized protein